VLADANHQQKDESDGNTNYDTDSYGEQQAFTQHQHHHQHIRKKTALIRHTKRLQGRLFISPVIFLRSFVIGGHICTGAS